MRRKGTIKIFSLRKGYGWIISTDGVRIVFHAEDIETSGSLKKGDAVSFDQREVGGGYAPKALHIRKTEGDDDA